MNPTILALAMLAQAETMAGQIQLQRIATAIIPVAEHHRLDPTLLAAIVVAEAGGRNIVKHHRGRKRRGADVGVFQIHCPGARPSCIKRYLQLAPSAEEAAQIIVQGRRMCQDPPPAYRRVCERGYWTRYNPGSVHWVYRVVSIWERIRAYLQLPAGAV